MCRLTLTLYYSCLPRCTTVVLARMADFICSVENFVQVYLHA